MKPITINNIHHHDYIQFIIYKDHPFILSKIKPTKLGLITAKARQIQKPCLKQLRHQKVLKR